MSFDFKQRGNVRFGREREMLPFPLSWQEGCPTRHLAALRQRFSQRGTNSAIIIAHTGSSLNRSGSPSSRAPLCVCCCVSDSCLPSACRRRQRPRSLAFSFHPASSQNVHIRPSPVSRLMCTRTWFIIALRCHPRFPFSCYADSLCLYLRQQSPGLL